MGVLPTVIDTPANRARDARGGRYRPGHRLMTWLP